jgi:hypothetical protein
MALAWALSPSFKDLGFLRGWRRGNTIIRLRCADSMHLSILPNLLLMLRPSLTALRSLLFSLSIELNLDDQVMMFCHVAVQLRIAGINPFACVMVVERLSGGVV